MFNAIVKSSSTIIPLSQSLSFIHLIYFVFFQLCHFLAGNYFLILVGKLTLETKALYMTYFILPANTKNNQLIFQSMAQLAVLSLAKLLFQFWREKKNRCHIHLTPKNIKSFMKCQCKLLTLESCHSIISCLFSFLAGKISLFIFGGKILSFFFFSLV